MPTYPAAGLCIYCGASRYSTGPDRKLGDEHVVPEGLGGDWVLPEASCEDCERRINEFEQPLIRGMYHVVRQHLGVKSKKRTPPGEANLIVTRDGAETTVPVPVQEYPGLITTFTFFRPTALAGLPSAAGELIGGIAMGFDEVGGKLLYDMMIGGSVSVPPHNGSQTPLQLARMLAKIGHSFAYAEKKFEGFRPLLQSLIRGEDVGSAGHLVGGTYDENPAPIEDRFSLELREETAPDGKLYLVCDIRIYAHLKGMPRYLVVVGEKENGHFARVAASSPIWKKTDTPNTTHQ